MLKVAGMWVSPMEVENTLLGHPHGRRAAVVAATDERGLAYSVAHIVLLGNVEGSEELAAEILRARQSAARIIQSAARSAILPRVAENSDGENSALQSFAHLQRSMIAKP